MNVNGEWVETGRLSRFELYAEGEEEERRLATLAAAMLGVIARDADEKNVRVAAPKPIPKYVQVNRMQGGTILARRVSMESRSLYAEIGCFARQDDAEKEEWRLIRKDEKDAREGEQIFPSREPAPAVVTQVKREYRVGLACQCGASLVLVYELDNPAGGQSVRCNCDLVYRLKHHPSDAPGAFSVMISAPELPSNPPEPLDL